MNQNILKAKLSVVLCGILLVGCGSSTKESRRSSSSHEKELNSNVENTLYFPPHLTVVSLSQDPLAKYQWHLVNVGQNSGAQLTSLEGEDLKMGQVWSSYRGRDIKIAIIDTGVELNHPDLNENIDLSLSYNYKTKSKDPSPTGLEPELAHGTACAGISSAVGFNKIGVRGVAPSSKIVGLNVFSNPTTTNFAQALFRSPKIDIYSNSWGEAEISADGISQIEMDAIIDGVSFGRDSLGSIYIFSSGNNRLKRHNANYFEEQNSRFVISVAALSARGGVASYSNPGANILVSGFGGGDGYRKPAIVTTDTSGLHRGFDNDYGEQYGLMDVPGNENGDYTHLMNGTSAAVPMVAGVVALMLEAAQVNNNFLTYRDIKYILATTARKNSPGSSSWQRNGAGHLVSHNYGFGAVNAAGAVEMAKSFSSLGKEKISNIYSTQGMYKFTKLYESKINVTSSSVEAIEFVDIWVDIATADLKDLKITLISPKGTESVLLTPYSPVPSNFLQGWRFGSAMHLDEETIGQWRLKVESISQNDEIQLNSWKVRFYGH